ncbi:hypothetical protein H2204_000861 [Knufia peltigerae]|uniref:Uncharacterized protein n=1 Tax=Knufia peltigerae TaxID=1002370 RepID=A0AA38YE90_9EURO|nr:hypothetical protein H2204_000861 [Knufia peltigerae]
MQTLSWPESKFLKWAKSDVDKAVAAAEEDLAFLDHVSQQSVTSNGAQDTFEASMENGRVSEQNSETLDEFETDDNDVLCQRYTSTGNRLTIAKLADAISAFDADIFRLMPFRKQMPFRPS